MHQFLSLYKHISYHNVTHSSFNRLRFLKLSDLHCSFINYPYGVQAPSPTPHVLVPINNPSSTVRSKRGTTYKPCKELVLFFHDVLYNGKNAHNATAVIIGGAEGSNRTTVTAPYHFGNLVAFDDPITLDNNFHGKPVGRAQGLYLYDKMDTFGAWLGFSFVLNSTDHKGSLNFIGSDPLMEKTRDISVVGGTGDFFMARGVATVSTDSFEGDVYFRLRVDIKLYECW